MLNEDYLKQVKLLIRVLPYIDKREMFLTERWNWH